MIEKININNEDNYNKAAQIIKESWKDNKVIHFKGLSNRIYDNPDLLREFYDNLISELGVPAQIGEDINLGDRSSQRSGQRWMEIRYDPKVKDAYRYSSNAQPLHTDGSYISSFPNASFIIAKPVHPKEVRQFLLILKM